MEGRAVLAEMISERIKGDIPARAVLTLRNCGETMKRHLRRTPLLQSHTVETGAQEIAALVLDRKSTRLNSSH